MLTILKVNFPSQRHFSSELLHLSIMQSLYPTSTQYGETRSLLYYIDVQIPYTQNGKKHFIRANVYVPRIKGKFPVLVTYGPCKLRKAIQTGSLTNAIKLPRWQGCTLLNVSEYSSLNFMPSKSFPVFTLNPLPRSIQRRNRSSQSGRPRTLRIGLGTVMRWCAQTNGEQDSPPAFLIP